MKIAFIAYDRKDYIGGPIINACRLLPEFVKRGHSVLAIVLYTYDYPNANYLKQFNIIVKTIPYSYTEKNTRQILKILKPFRPDVFVPNISVAGGYAAYWIEKANIPSIIALRSEDTKNWCYANTFGLKNWKWKVSGLVCVSHYLKQQCFKKTNSKNNITVIPSGIPVSKNSSKQSDSCLKVIYAGRLEQEQKRIWDIIKTFSEISKIDQSIKFTLLGEGTQKDKLIEFVKRHNCEQNITFIDKLVGKKYHTELSNHDVIVLLSDYEGLPGSIMDGMTCGLVPICFNFNGIKEIVKHMNTGIIVNDRDETFIQSVLNLKRDYKLRNKLSLSAKNFINNNYSLSISASKWEYFFSKLISLKGNKKSIKIPLFLNLPDVPSCYKSERNQDLRLNKFIKIKIWRKINFLKSYLKKAL